MLAPACNNQILDAKLFWCMLIATELGILFPSSLQTKNNDEKIEPVLTAKSIEYPY